MIDRDNVKKLYLNGYNANQIAKKLKYNVEAVRKCIQRNYSSLEDQYKHKISIIEQKETLKAVNYEANRYMSDKSFILKNRSIYETKSNGDIVVNRKVAPVISWDTPKRLNNENKCVI